MDLHLGREGVGGGVWVKNDRDLTDLSPMILIIDNIIIFNQLFMVSQLILEIIIPPSFPLLPLPANRFPDKGSHLGSESGSLGDDPDPTFFTRARDGVCRSVGDGRGD